MWAFAKLLPAKEFEGVEMTFHENQMESIMPGGPTVKGTFVVRGESSPYELDIKYAKGGEKRLVPALVSVDQDTIRLCHPRSQGGLRPKKIASTEENMLMVFRRGK